MLGMRMTDDHAHWRQRAQEARAEADKMDDPDAKQTLLEIAAAFERLAEIAERRTTAKRA
jgi:hypothetical protein